MQEIRDAQAAFLYIKEAFDEQVDGHEGAERLKSVRELANLFAFVEKIFRIQAMRC